MGAVRVVRRWLGVMAAVSALALTAPTGQPAAATPAGTQSYLQFNMCGNQCNHGGLAVVRNLEQTIGGDRPVAVTLNEVCENQYDRLRRDLSGYRGGFDPTGPRCDNGTRYGNAVFVRGSGLDTVGSWQLPNPGSDETRRLMCVRGRPALVVCVTHISFVAENIGVQVDAVAGILRGLRGDGPVLLGGDFNTDPTDTRLDPVYSRRREADSAVNHTTFARRKIDYIFLADGYWTAARAAVVDAGRGLSDHGALLATALVTDGDRNP